MTGRQSVGNCCFSHPRSQLPMAAGASIHRQEAGRHAIMSCVAELTVKPAQAEVVVVPAALTRSGDWRWRRRR